MSFQTTRTDRIQLIDVLRGFALLGIIIVHFTEQYYAGGAPQKATHLNATQLPDQIVMGFISFLITGKFYMMFSFLFGLSFFIQFSKSDGSAKFYFRFFWRLVVLFAIGWIHHLHYRGDILTIYALLGIGLLIFHKLPDRALLIIAIALVVNVPSFVTRGVEAIQFEQSEKAPAPPFAQDDKANEKYFDTLKSGAYAEVLKANVPEFKSKMDFQMMSGRIYITLGLFLLGLYAGRRKVFENITHHLIFFKKARNRSLWMLLGLILFSASFFGGAQLLKIELSQPLQWMVGGLVFDLFNACQAMFYVCVIILLYQKEKWNARLQYFYEVGRMGLTTYLMQTFFGVLIFFGFGFNLLDEIGAATCLVIALILYAAQIAMARWWLSQFNYGPVEWLWRSLTFLKWQPLKKAASNELTTNP